MGRIPSRKLIMNSGSTTNNVTAPKDSDPQLSAVVGGLRSTVTGQPTSSSNDRETKWRSHTTSSQERKLDTQLSETGEGAIRPGLSSGQYNKLVQDVSVFKAEMKRSRTAPHTKAIVMMIMKNQIQEDAHYTSLKIIRTPQT